MKTTTLVPAYGRDYKSKAAVLADWNDNKNFRIWTGWFSESYVVNKQQVKDLKDMGITHIQFRYKGLTQTFVMEVK